MPTRPTPRTIGNARDSRGRPLLETGSVLAGAGFTGTGSLFKQSIERRGSIITTRFLIDLTGMASSTTDLDIIGAAAGGAAYFARIVAAEHGTIVGGRCECLEVPAGGVVDIDIYAATEATGVYDGAIASLTETAVCTSGGSWTLGRVVGTVADGVAANAYLYMTGGAAGTAGTYTAGRFLITLIGYDA